MRKDSRLSRMLHILVHMERLKDAATSESLATIISTNPVVVRRTMASLRDQGFVSSVKGHGGGWRLAVPLSEISLLDIHHALGDSSVFTIGLTDEHDNCPIEMAVNQALRDVMQEAEALLLARFGEITLDKLAKEFDLHANTSLSSE